jgi:hypothetical protein
MRARGAQAGRAGKMPCRSSIGLSGVMTPGRATPVMRMQGFTRTVWLALSQQLGVPKAASTHGV